MQNLFLLFEIRVKVSVVLNWFQLMCHILSHRNINYAIFLICIYSLLILLTEACRKSQVLWSGTLLDLISKNTVVRDITLTLPYHSVLWFRNKVHISINKSCSISYTNKPIPLSVAQSYSNLCCQLVLK